MAKYHITAKGVPAICRATKRPCPLGGADAHFDSIEDAQAHIDKTNQKEFGLMGVAEAKKSPVAISDEELRGNLADLSAVAAVDSAMNDYEFLGAADDNFSDGEEVYSEVTEQFRKVGFIGDDEELLTYSEYELQKGGKAGDLPRRLASDSVLKNVGLSNKGISLLKNPIRTEGTAPALVVVNNRTGKAEHITQLEGLALMPNENRARMTEGYSNLADKLSDDYDIRASNRPVTDKQFEQNRSDSSVAILNNLTNDGFTDGLVDGFTDEGKLDKGFVGYGKELGVFKGEVLSPSEFEKNGKRSFDLPQEKLTRDDLIRVGVSHNIADDVLSKANKDDKSASVIVKTDEGYKRYTDYQGALINATRPESQAWNNESREMLSSQGIKLKDLI